MAYKAGRDGGALVSEGPGTEQKNWAEAQSPDLDKHRVTGAGMQAGGGLLRNKDEMEEPEPALPTGLVG